MHSLWMCVTCCECNFKKSKTDGLICLCSTVWILKYIMLCVLHLLFSILAIRNWSYSSLTICRDAAVLCRSLEDQDCSTYLQMCFARLHVNIADVFDCISDMLINLPDRTEMIWYCTPVKWGEITTAGFQTQSQNWSSNSWDILTFSPNSNPALCPSPTHSYSVCVFVWRDCHSKCHYKPVRFKGVIKPFNTESHRYRLLNHTLLECNISFASMMEKTHIWFHIVNFQGYLLSHINSNSHFNLLLEELEVVGINMLLRKHCTRWFNLIPSVLLFPQRPDQTKNCKWKLLFEKYGKRRLEVSF